VYSVRNSHPDFELFQEHLAFQKYTLSRHSAVPSGNDEVFFSEALLGPLKIELSPAIFVYVNRRLLGTSKEQIAN
jgi:hypothetical protein